MLPQKLGRGRQSKTANERYQQELEAFAEYLKSTQEQLDFKMSPRGWCYFLENEGMITKAEFDYAGSIIIQLRKEGLIPLDFVAEEEARRFSCIEREIDKVDPTQYAHHLLAVIGSLHQRYYGRSFWSDKEYYIQMIVEKVDLKTLFEPICRKYFIPLATGRGWSSISQLDKLVESFQDHEKRGRQPVLLYCGDHDPTGFQISDTIKKNLHDLQKATGWDPRNLIVDRFGLNHDFIQLHNLSTIPNLETGSGKDLADPGHRDHKLSYVQDYINNYGVWKCEANAIVVIPQLGRQLCEDAINKYISRDAVSDHWENINYQQDEVKNCLRALLLQGAWHRYF